MQRTVNSLALRACAGLDTSVVLPTDCSAAVPRSASRLYRMRIHVTVT